MDSSTFPSLLTPEGQSALGTASALSPKEADFLRHFTALSKKFPEEIARAALEVAILRAGAAGKFGEYANKMYFNREALEQASSLEVASWRARRYEPFGTVVDLGCSVGGDTLALTLDRRGVTVGVDRDPLRLAMAKANAQAAGVDDRVAFLCADLESPLPVAPGTDTALFFDPGRRDGERRARSVRHYSPALDVIRAWLDSWPALGVKISPAVRMEEISGYHAEIEFISLGGELKESVLWFGPLRAGDDPRRATVLPGAHTMTGVPDFDGGQSALRPQLSEPRAYLYEPDPAVIRAGLVRQLGAQLDATQVDPEIAFLTSDALVETPFARALPIEDWMPFHGKRLRAYLRERGIGKVTVKKRGSPLDAERLARDLRCPGEHHRLIVLTQLDGKPIVLICGESSMSL